MEVKKIIILLLIPIFIFLSLFLFSDNSQYKRIGDTNFYLLPNETGQESFLYHNGESDEKVFSPITHEGLVHDVFWNQQFIIVKCSRQKDEKIGHWYIINNIKDYKYSELGIRHFLNEQDYLNALDSLGVHEINMEHTVGKIPWRIHF